MIGLVVVSAQAAPPDGFEAAWRAAAAKFATVIQPGMSEANQQELQAGLATVDPKPPLARRAGPSTHPSVFQVATAFYVSPSMGCSDHSPGSEAKPFCSVLKGVLACRAVGKCAVFLREGVHRLNETIVLGPADSGLVIAGYEGENAVISGTTPLEVSAWQKVSDEGEITIWKVPVTTRPAAIETLLVDGVRAIPARYPNADPEIDRFPIGYVQSETEWSAPAALGPSSYIRYNGSEMFRPSYRSLFQDFRGGVGGQCAHYDPPFSYWCAEEPQGGGAAQYVVPSGLTFDAAQLPNAPYANVTGGRVTAWRPGHWANWQFELKGSMPAATRGSRMRGNTRGGDATANATRLTFGRGGFQGGRGNARGAEWFVSHLREELDFPREYWYDAEHATLYFASGKGTLDCKGDPNCVPTREQRPPVAGSGGPDGRAPPVFEAAQLKTLFRLQGTQAAPVVGVTFSALTFTGAASTFLDPRGRRLGAAAIGSALLRGGDQHDARGLRAAAARRQRGDAQWVQSSCQPEPQHLPVDRRHCHCAVGLHQWDAPAAALRDRSGRHSRQLPSVHGRARQLCAPPRHPREAELVPLPGKVGADLRHK